MTWFGPKDCNCGCEISSSSSIIDPCDCGSESTMYIKIEVSGLPNYRVRYAQFCGPGVPCQLQSECFDLDSMNGTYFVPLNRNCSGSPPTFSLNVLDAPINVHNYTGSINYDCSGNPTPASGGIDIIRSSGDWVLSITFPANLTSFPILSFPSIWCGPSATSTSGGTNIFHNPGNQPPPGCESLLSQNIGRMDWSMPFPGPMP